MCFRCGIDIDFFVHCTWLCIKVAPSGMTSELYLDPELSLLGNVVSRSVNKHQVKFIEVTLYVARKRIATTLKSASPLGMYHYIQ